MYTLPPENFEEKRKKGKCTKVALGKKNSIQIFSKKKKKKRAGMKGRGGTGIHKIHSHLTAKERNRSNLSIRKGEKSEFHFAYFESKD